ncbi:hypothetical protein [Cupriavidus basilensis]|nr:hypothetical protein [Cupriavidus basilensis]
MVARQAGARTQPDRTEKLIGNAKKNPFVARGDRADHQLTALYWRGNRRV